MRSEINKIKADLKPYAKQAGINRSGDCTLPSPYWDGERVRKSNELWQELCERVLWRVKNREDYEDYDDADDVYDAYDAECDDGGINAVEMSTEYQGVHYVVSAETLGTKPLTDSYITTLAETLTDIGYPTRANTSRGYHDRACGAIPEDILAAADEKAREIFRERSLEILTGEYSYIDAMAALSDPSHLFHDEVVDVIVEAIGYRWYKAIVSEAEEEDETHRRLIKLAIEVLKKTPQRGD